MFKYGCCKLSSRNGIIKGGYDKNKIGDLGISVGSPTYDISYELKKKLKDRILGNMIKFDLILGGITNIDDIEESSESFDSSDSDISFDDLETKKEIKGGLIVHYSEQDNFS